MRSPVWAVTSYFAFDDPPGTKRRLQTYRRFRERLQVPLVTVEHAPDGNFDLQEGDAEVLIQRSGGAMLWQKERLLNLGLEHLPAACDSVVWIDCDMVFERDNWPQALGEALQETPVVQPFRTIRLLRDGEFPETTEEAPEREDWRSFGYCFAAGLVPPEAFQSSTVGPDLRIAGGFVWAARRELLDRHGLYDAMILGGGDKGIVCAACGHADAFPASRDMSPEQARHYLDWARPFEREVAGRVGDVPGRVFHLWHGDLRNRRYRGRYEDFARLGFAPGEHLRLTEEGVWDWSGEPAEVRRRVKEYFDARRG